MSTSVNTPSVIPIVQHTCVEYGIYVELYVEWNLVVLYHSFHSFDDETVLCVTVYWKSKVKLKLMHKEDDVKYAPIIRIECL